MKILLVSDVDLSLPGGLETHLLELARGLTARGHQVDVTARAARPLAEPAPRLIDRSLVDPAAYDILHHHGGAWPRTWRHLAGPARARAPATLGTFHFSVAAKMGVYLRMGRIRTLFNPGNHRALAEERAALGRGALHIAVSRSLRDELVRFHGTPRESIEVIPNGASFASPRLGRAAWRERHQIAPGARLLLTIGRDDYVKGFDLLSRAWALPGAHPDGALWIRVGGSRPDRTADTLTTGPIAPEEVIEWIHASDAGAFPSYYEGGGIALTDMLAGGLFVLSHAVGVAPEVLRAGENGEFVPRRAEAWATALARVLASPPRPPAPALGPEWSWGAMAARVEGVYQGLRGRSA